MLNVQGTTALIYQCGEMGITKHTSVVKTLEMQALRYRWKDRMEIEHNEVLYGEAVEKRETVTNTFLS